MTDSNDGQVNDDFGWTADFDSVQIPDPVEFNPTSLNQKHIVSPSDETWPGVDIDTSQTLNSDTFDTVNDNGRGSKNCNDRTHLEESSLTESIGSDPNRVPSSKPNEIVVKIDEINGIFNGAFKNDGSASMSHCDQSTVLKQCSVEEWKTLVNSFTTNLRDDL